jgi:hypothetical protein
MEIFLSYSRQNADQILALVEDIEALGHNVWYDHEISGGQSWWDQILERIRLSDVFVFALSPHSLESRPCLLESGYAFDLHKRILPVLVADGVASATLPEALSVIQFIDYRFPDKQAAIRLSKSLVSLPPAAPLPDPLPAPPVAPIKYLGRLKSRIESDEALSFQEQAALLFELRQHMNDTAERDEVLRLLRLFRRRDDLLAKIADEIDSLITSMSVPTSSSAPAKPPERISKPPIQKPPTATVSTTVPVASTNIQPVGLGDVLLPIVGFSLIVGYILGEFVLGMSLVLVIIIFGVPGLVVALLLWFGFRGTQITLPVQDRQQFIESLKRAMPRRFELVSESGDMLVFKWFHMPLGLKRLNRIFVQLDKNSATMTGPARFVNRIQEKLAA